MRVAHISLYIHPHMWLLASKHPTTQPPITYSAVRTVTVLKAHTHTHHELDIRFAYASSLFASASVLYILPAINIGTVKLILTRIRCIIVWITSNKCTTMQRTAQYELYFRYPFFDRIRFRLFTLRILLEIIRKISIQIEAT